MLSRTEELTALFETLGVLSCALMACLSRGWCTAIDEAREQGSSVEAIDDDWVHQQLLLWAERHHKRVKNFQSDFLTSVLPRFYTGLGKLHIGLMTCLSRGWCTAIDEARAQISSVVKFDDDWFHQHIWAECDEKCAEFFQRNFLMS